MFRQKITRQTNHEKERDYDRKKYDYESKKEPETVYGKKIFLPVYSNLNNLSDDSPKTYIKEVKSINSLTDVDKIYAGQRIVIPYYSTELK